MPSSQNCSCQSGKPYADCCAPFHEGTQLPPTPEALMRSRYCAYVLHDIDYIVATTVPEQQPLLDKAAMSEWSRNTQWLGLEVLKHIPNIGKHHAQVEFKAYFEENGSRQSHHELSAFVKPQQRWYFIDPTVPLPALKQPCICGSGKKFKQCCGRFFK